MHRSTRSRLGISCLSLIICASPLTSANNFSRLGSEAISAVTTPVEVIDLSAGPSRSRYLVRLEEDPVAVYRGTIAGLRPTHPELTGARKLDASAQESRAYRAYLETAHINALSRIGLQLGRPPVAVAHFYYANNGLALELTAKEAALVRKVPGVLDVQRERTYQPNTDAGPEWIGAVDLWPESTGEGQIVGVIDSGINPSNPSFADVGGDGYDHTNPLGSGIYRGVCDPNNTSPPAGVKPYDPAFPCNDKLIGAWGHALAGGNSPYDDDGHGSHTASTTAGNAVTATIEAPTITQSVPITGVAPHANIIVYDVLSGSVGTGTAIAWAIDQAIADGVDVINFSIGSSVPYAAWSDFIAIGFGNARAAGIFVAAAAGNDGPFADTIGSPANAPWLTAVGSSTHDRRFRNALVDLSGGDTAPPTDLIGAGFTSGYGPAPIVHASTAGDPLCLSPFPAGTWTQGEIVVCDRGINARIAKGENLLAGGAGGFVLTNAASDGESTIADAHVLPAVHLGYADSEVLRAWLASGTSQTAKINGLYREVDPALADIMSGFSSRGISQSLPSIIKPDVTAPGADILAASGTDDEIAWTTFSGTSMASPHVAGAAVLLKDVHPNWTPAEIQSALMTTGVTTLLKEDGATPADPLDFGGGRVDVATASAAGLVLDESIADYVSANPATGGDPTQINLASLGNSVCPGFCRWTRTVRSTLGSAATWRASVTNPPGWELRVEPAVLNLPAGGEQTFTVSAHTTKMPGSGWEFGKVVLEATGRPPAVLPVALSMQPVPRVQYEWTTSLKDACYMPAANSGAYVDLEQYGFVAEPTIHGDDIAIPFDGSGWFYDGTYYDFAVTDNGYGVFGLDNLGSGGVVSPQSLPSPAAPNNLIAPLWADLEIVYDEAQNHGLTPAVLTDPVTGRIATLFEFDDAVLAGTSTSVGDFEVLFWDEVDPRPGAWEIIFAYDNLNVLPTTATIGIENGDGTDATVLFNAVDPTAEIQDGLAICFDAVLGPCQDYLVLQSGDAVSQEQHDARHAIVAGGDYAIRGGGDVRLRTAAGGAIRFFPGFRVADHGRLTATPSGASCP